MRLVLDTNIVIAAFLWRGPPRQLLDQIIERSDIELYSSSLLLSELSEVLSRPRFAQRINVAGLTVNALLTDYTDLVTTIASTPLSESVSRDPDDDEVLACALAANADAIISGDHDLITLKIFQGIPILTVTQMITKIAA